MRRAAKRDLTEPAIVDALRQVGAQILRLGPFDLLVLFRGKLFMLDSKSRHGRPTSTQAALIALGWPLTFVETPEAALEAIGAKR